MEEPRLRERGLIRALARQGRPVLDSGAMYRQSKQFSIPRGARRLGLLALLLRR
jgi:hypothetical protein